MSLPLRQIAIGPGRVGRASRLMICVEPVRRSFFNASPLNKVQGPAGTVRCELRDAGMQWPGWDSLFAGNTLLDCRLIAPSDPEAFLIKRAKVLWWMEKQTDEMEDGVWFEPVTTFCREKCDKEWTQEKKNRVRHWLTDGAFTQDAT